MEHKDQELDPNRKGEGSVGQTERERSLIRGEPEPKRMRAGLVLGNESRPRAVALDGPCRRSRYPGTARSTTNEVPVRSKERGAMRPGRAGG